MTFSISRRLVLAAGAFAVFAASQPALSQAAERTIVVGSSATYAPFAFENSSREVVGFDIDIVNAIAEKQGLKLRIVNTPFTSIFASLNNGDVDTVISGVTINDRRKQSFDFSQPYFDARQLIAVPQSSDVKSLDDIKGKKVAVVSGSTADDVVSRLLGKTSPDIRRFESTPLIISELASGGVDAAIGDNGVIAYRVAQASGLKVVEDPDFPKESFGIVVRKGDDALREQLDAGLAAIRADGSYNTIYKKWFNQEYQAR